MFFSPAINAARGIDVQVQNTCQQFYSNFQMALNPQLTKSYAQGNLNSMHKLLIKSSKFSFYILFIIAMPLMFEANFVLKIWLGIVPNHAVNFLRLILIIGLLYTLSNPIIVSVHATGKLKRFQMIEGTMLLMIVPIAYFLLKYFNIRPEVVFVVHIIVEICTQYVRLKIVLPMINMKLGRYFKEVVLPILLVVLVSPIIPLGSYYKFYDESFLFFLIICSVCVLCSVFVIFTLGCTSNERQVLNRSAKI